MAKRKRLQMLVTVSVPADMPASDARREVRTLISEQCFYSADEGDVKAISVKPARPDPHLQRTIAELRWQLGRGARPE